MPPGGSYLEAPLLVRRQRKRGTGTGALLRFLWEGTGPGLAGVSDFSILGTGSIPSRLAPALGDWGQGVEARSVTRSRKINPHADSL